MPSENAHFSIIYDGEGLAEGSIDAKDLAPALLALAEVVDEAQPLVPELDARLSLRVRSDFQRGSFEIHLELAKLYQQLVGLFSGQDATAFANLFQILGITGVLGVLGLFQLIKRAKGRKSTSVTIERSERVKITFEGDTDSVEADKRTWQLFQNLRVRKAIEQVIAPLTRDGIETFEIKHRGKQSVKVTQDEAKYFLAPTEHEGETVSVVDTRVSIVAPNFQQGNKWRVSDGSRTIFVSIEDPAFVGVRIPVHAGPPFRSMPGHHSGPCRATLPDDAGRGVKRVTRAIVASFYPKEIAGGASEVTHAEDSRGPAPQV